jgi:hypothetical protein
MFDGMVAPCATGVKRMPAIAIDLDLYAVVADLHCWTCRGTGLVPEADGVDVDMPGASVSWLTGAYLPCPVCAGAELPY